MGSVNVLEAARSCPSVRAIVNVTSDKCYENREWEFAYRENDAMGGYDPYSASKGAAEIVTAAYRQSFFGPTRAAAVASGRAGNVIGGGDWALDRIVPDCVRALSAGEPIVVRNPDAVRPWQHVLEPVGAYLWLASRLFTRRPCVRRRLELRPGAERQPHGGRGRRSRPRGVGRRLVGRSCRRHRQPARGTLPEAGLLQGRRRPGLAACVGCGHGAANDHPLVPRLLRRRDVGRRADGAVPAGLRRRCGRLQAEWTR